MPPSPLRDGYSDDPGHPQSLPTFFRKMIFLIREPLPTTFPPPAKVLIRIPPILNCWLYQAPSVFPPLSLRRSEFPSFPSATPSDVFPNFHL